MIKVEIRKIAQVLLASGQVRFKPKTDLKATCLCCHPIFQNIPEVLELFISPLDILLFLLAYSFFLSTTPFCHSLAQYSSPP